MPQRSDYTLYIDDSTSVLINAGQLPAGFDTMSSSSQHSVALLLVKDHIAVLSGDDKPATFKDFAIPIGLLIVFALVILWIAKKIRDNPKMYDTVVKMDGEPNVEYGKNWNEKK